MIIDPKLAEFLFLNMFAHDPYHDFSKGASSRLSKSINRLTSLTWLVQDADGGASLRGGKKDDLDARSAVADTNPSIIATHLEYDKIVNDIDNEFMGVYSEFGYNATIWNILSLRGEDVGRNLASWISDSDKTNFTKVLAEMKQKIVAVLPKGDDNTPIGVDCKTAIETDIVTRATAAKRREFIQWVQDMVETIDVVRVAIVTNAGEAGVATGAAGAATREAGGSASKGGEAKILPPTAPINLPFKLSSLNATIPKPLMLVEAQAAPTVQVSPAPAPASAPAPVPAPAPAPAPAVQADALVQVNEQSRPGQALPARTAYANMYYSLANLYQMYQEEQNSLVSNGGSVENIKALDEMKNIIQFYKYAFEYYTTHIENMSSMYSINNSDFIKDVLFYYFFDLCENISNRDTAKPRKLMDAGDASYRNMVFKIIYMLRNPVNKDMAGGAIGNVMAGGDSEQYNTIFNGFNAIAVAECVGSDDNYTITVATKEPIKFNIEGIESKISDALTALQTRVREHLIEEAKRMLNDQFDELLAAITSTINGVFTNNDKISVWEKQYVNQLGRFMVNAGKRTGIKSINDQLTGLYVHCKGEMLRLLQRHKATIVAAKDASAASDTGSSAEGNKVIGTFLQYLSKRILDAAGKPTPKYNKDGSDADGSDALYNAQISIINEIADSGKCTGDADGRLLTKFIKSGKDNNQLTEVNTQNFINDNILENALKSGFAKTSKGTHVNVKMINNALTTTGSDGTTRYVDELVQKNGSNTDNKQGEILHIKNMCPVTCVLDAMGSFGSCMKGSSSDYYEKLRDPTQIFITDNIVEGGFEFNMTTRHSAKKGTSNNGVVVVEYYIIYKGFTVSNCVIEAMVKDSAVNILSANNTFAELLNYIEQNAPAGPDAQIKWEDFFDAHGENIVRIISRKMIGDFGQEMSAVYPKGGYTNVVRAEWESDLDKIIKLSGDKQYILKMNGDRPSFVRESKILMAASDQANLNTITVYLGSSFGVVVMSKAVAEYMRLAAVKAEENAAEEARSKTGKKGGAVQTKRNNQTKKRTTKNHRRTRKISPRKTRRLRRNP